MEKKNDTQLELQKNDNENPMQLGQANPSHLLELAISKGADIDQLEKLMALQERWTKQQAEKAFNFAKNEFQANKPSLFKSKEVEFNGKKQYSYIPLGKIQKAIDPVLSKHGLSYGWRQTVENDGKIRITCVLSHVDGHSEETWLESGKDGSGSKNDIQSLGSTVSYLKRYTLTNICGLSSDDDDDGESSEYTKEEVREMMRDKIVDLLADKEDKLSEDEVKRIDAIVAKSEHTSYKKVVTFLESK